MGVRVTLLTLRAGGDFQRRLASDVPYEELGLAGTFLGIPKLLTRLRRSPAAFVLTNCATSACLVSLFRCPARKVLRLRKAPLRTDVQW